MTETDDQLLIFGVKLLFRRIEEGEIKFVKDKVPKLLEALEAVKFDGSGEPILETVTSPVRAMVNMVRFQEIEQEKKKRANESPVHEYIGEAVRVDEEALRKCAERGDFGELAFELYKETAIVLNLCAHTSIGDTTEEAALPRNQAICAGLLVRVTKFMTTVVQLTSTAHRGDVVLALNRCILESATNLRYLIARDDTRIYDQFVRFSLGPERELYDTVQANIKARDKQEVLPIEQRILSSIERICRLSGTKIEEVDQKYGDWGGGMRERLKALAEESRYLAIQRIPSHAVHGTWVDLLLHHLEEKGERFVPHASWSRSDARLLAPVAYLALDAGAEYLRKFLGSLPELKPVFERIDDLKQRIRTFEEAHEKWLSEDESAKPGPNGD